MALAAPLEETGAACGCCMGVHGMLASTHYLSNTGVSVVQDIQHCQCSSGLANSWGEREPMDSLGSTHLCQAGEAEHADLVDDVVPVARGANL